MNSLVSINKTHYSGNDNTFKFNLSSNTDLNDYTVAISSGFVYYSWYNISAARNNNKFSIIIPVDGTTITLSLTIPDGAYDISTLNSWLEEQLLAGGYYYRYAGDASNVTTGEIRQSNIYPCKFQVNPHSYSIQFIAISMPRTSELVAPTFNGYTSGGFVLPSTTNKSCQLVIPSGSSFGDIIGYAAGTFGTGTGATTIESTIVPNVNPSSAIEMRLSCISNPLSINSQLLHTFSNKDARLGELIDISPNELIRLPCSGQHRELTLQFYDQTGAKLTMIDHNITIELVFTKK